MPREPQDRTIDMIHPKGLDSLTPDLHDTRQDPRSRRTDKPEPSAEPTLQTVPDRAAAGVLRETAVYSIIARHLFRNRKNEQILESLREAGHPMGLRTLQRIFSKSDFQSYYESYRAQLMAPVDQQIREEFRLAMPEALNELIRLMRSAVSEKVRHDAAINILQGGGGLRKESVSREYIVNISPDNLKDLAKAGERIAQDFNPTDVLKLQAPKQDADPDPGPAKEAGSE